MTHELSLPPSSNEIRKENDLFFEVVLIRASSRIPQLTSIQVELTLTWAQNTGDVKFWWSAQDTDYGDSGCHACMHEKFTFSTLTST
jgi:hypothetical protein